MQVTKQDASYQCEDQTLEKVFVVSVFQPNLGDDYKRKKSSPSIRYVIFRLILRDDERNKQELSVRHFAVPIFDQNLELTRDNFHGVSKSHSD